MSENFRNFKDYEIVEYITKQTWFYSSWKQDPTIQAMLRMLKGTEYLDNKGENFVDGIEELFKDVKNFDDYKDLLFGNNCPIVFYYLDLKDFGLSDELYIKMNARGKQLTSFENFKADLIGYIYQKSIEESSDQKAWEGLLDPVNGIPIKMDTTWTKIFWDNKSKGIPEDDNPNCKRKTNHIDEIFFAFINRFFWNELFFQLKEDKAGENKHYKYFNDSQNENANDFDTKIAYEGLDIYRYDTNEIPLVFLNKLQRILDNYRIYIEDKKYKIPKCHWMSNFEFIPKYATNEHKDNIEITNNAGTTILKVTTLNQVERILFFALCKFFDEYDEERDDQTTLERWFRVVCNIISDQDRNERHIIRNVELVKQAILLINGLDTHDVYGHLFNKEIDNKDSSLNRRLRAEKEKATKILEDNKWEEHIKEAEKFAFFHGNIDVLYKNEKYDTCWEHFIPKWENIKKNFDDENGKYHDVDGILMRKFISYFDEWKYLYDVNVRLTFDTTKATWIDILLQKSKDLAAPIHSLLIDNDTSLTEYFISPFNDTNQKRVHEEIVNTSLITKIVEGCVLNIYNDIHILYPKNSHAEWKKYIIASMRNNTLYQLVQNKKISTAQQLDTLPFFWGWNIEFGAKDRHFKWDWSNKISLLNNGEYEEILNLQDGTAACWYERIIKMLDNL
jgi:hypothetical protein